MRFGLGMKLGNTAIRRGSSAPAYNPATETGAVLLYEADHATNVISGGTAFSQLTDLTGNGRHAVQATGTKQPAVLAAGLNGRQVARFDGTSDSMGITLSALTSVTAFTLYFVFINGPTSGTNRFLYDCNPARTAAAVGADVGGQIGWYEGAWRKPGVAGTATAQVLAYEVNGPSLEFKLYRNGAQVGSTVSMASARPLFPSGSTNAICAQYDQSTGFYPIDLASVFIVSSLRSTHNVSNRVDDYFRTKWGTP